MHFPGKGPKIIDGSTATKSTEKERAGPQPGMAQRPATYSNVLTGAPTGVNIPTPQQRRLEAEAINARRREDQRARNRGQPLLPLQSDGLPQFSVVPSFSKPKPEDLFIGKDGEYVRYVQAHWEDVLLRSAHLNGKFVVWAEPKREGDKASLPASLPSAKRFLEAWNHRAKGSKRPVTLRDYFMDWQEATVRDEVAAKYQSPNAQPAPPQRDWQEDMTGWMQKLNDSYPQNKDQEVTNAVAPEEDHVPSALEWEDDLAMAMLQQDGRIDPVEYKARKIVYDTVTEDFMPLCDYDALQEERWREEFEKEIEDMETQSLVVSPTNQRCTQSISLTLKRPIVRM